MFDSIDPSSKRTLPSSSRIVESPAITIAVLPSDESNPAEESTAGMQEQLFDSINPLTRNTVPSPSIEVESSANTQSSFLAAELNPIFRIPEVG